MEQEHDVDQHWRLHLIGANVPDEYMKMGAPGVAEYIRFLRSQLVGEKARTEYLFEQLERAGSSRAS